MNYTLTSGGKTFVAHWHNNAVVYELREGQTPHEVAQVAYDKGFEEQCFCNRFFNMGTKTAEAIDKTLGTQDWDAHHRIVVRG